jgi:hypothetical protein
VDTEPSKISLEELHNKLNDAFAKGDNASVEELMKLEVTEDAAATAPVVETPVEVPVEKPEEKPPVETTAPVSKSEAPKDKTETAPATTKAEAPQQLREDMAWVETLPDETKAKVLKLLEDKNSVEHKFKSNLGRIQAYQRTLDTDRRTISELQSKLKDPKPLASAPAAKIERTEDLERLSETDPQFARALESYVQKAMQSVQQTLAKGADERFARIEDAVNTTEQSRYIQHQQSLVLREFPNAAEVVTDPYFSKWLEHQPPSVQAQRYSPHAEDGIDLLWRYTYFLEDAGLMAKQPVETAQQPEPAKAPVAPPVAKTDANAEAERIAAARAGRQAPKQTSSSVAPTTSSGDDNLEYWFKKGVSDANKRYGG